MVSGSELSLIRVEHVEQLGASGRLSARQEKSAASQLVWMVGIAICDGVGSGITQCRMDFADCGAHFFSNAIKVGPLKTAIRWGIADRGRICFILQSAKPQASSPIASRGE